MNPLSLFKKISILPLLIALALLALAAAPVLATPPVEFGAWSVPINVGPSLNTEYNDMYAILTADGLTVYFTSDRPGGLGLDDLWVSRRESTDSPLGRAGKSYRIE
jgi:WD40-like Beta Propeller Repeat